MRIRAVPFLVLVLLGSFSLAWAQEGVRVRMPKRGLCAHRGAMGTHPENTLTAFREAIRVGAHMIEFDVHLTEDKQLVVIHDETVDRTTNGHGKVAELTLAEIKTLDAGSWKGPQFAGERVPTLRETLQAMPINIWLNVHLKGGAELGEKVAKVIAEESRQHQAFLACRKEAAKAARAAVPDILIGNLERQGGSREYVDDTIAMKAAFIQLLGTQHPDYPAYIRELRRAGVRINYCCTDVPKELWKLFSAGVEFPLVDQIQSSMKAAGKLGVAPWQPVFREPR